MPDGFLRRVLESATIVAAASVPLFLTPFTENVFEPSKVAVLRGLGATVATAVLLVAVQRARRARQVTTPADVNAVRALTHVRRHRYHVAAPPKLRWAIGAVRQYPLPAAIGVFLAAQVVATVFASSPAISLLGSYARSQGLITQLALIALAIGAAGLARSELAPRDGRPGPAEPGPVADLRRLPAVIACAALPAALYAVLQARPFALDPLPWTGDVTTRVTGPMGNSVMLAGFLAACLPLISLCAARLLDGVPPRTPTRRVARALQGAGAAAWLVSGLAVVAGLVLTASRGPLLALVAGGAAGLLAVSAITSRRRVGGFVVVLGAVSVALVLALNLGAPVVAPLRGIPVFDRLATVLDPDRDTVRVRLRLWQGTADTLADGAPLVTGSGLESMPLVWARHYPPILAYDEPRGYIPDRAHNLGWDALLQGGLLLLGATLLLYGTAIDVCLQGAGLVRSWRDRLEWAGSAAAGGLIGGGLPLAVGTLACVPEPERAATVGVWAGAGCLTLPGFGVGLVAGLVTWLGWRALRSAAAANPGSAWGRPSSAATSWFAVAALAVLVTHFAELQVAFPVAGTQLVTWLVIGGLAGAHWPRASEARDSDAQWARPTPPVENPPVTILAATAVGLTYAFVFARPGLVSGGAPVAALLTVFSVAATALSLGPFNVGAPTPEQDPVAGQLRAQARHLGLALTASAVFAALQVAALRWATVSAADSVGAVGIDLGLYAAALVGLVIAGAWMSRGQDARRRADTETAPSRITWRSAGAAGWGAVIAFASGTFALVALSVMPLVGEASAKEARVAWLPQARDLRARAESGLAFVYLDQAADRLGRAALLMPWIPEHRLALARLETERADLAAERLARAHAQGDALPPGYSETRDRAFRRALDEAASAARLAPGWPEPLITAARTARLWAERTADLPEGGSTSVAVDPAAVDRARSAYRRAIAAAPNFPELYDEAAWVELLEGDDEPALALTDQSISIDPFYQPARRTAAMALAEMGRFGDAADAYADYFSDYRNAADLVAQRAYLEVLTLAGRPRDAVAVAKTVVRLAPNDSHARADLAVLLNENGDRSAALAAARTAAVLDPNDPGIAALVHDLEGH